MVTIATVGTLILMNTDIRVLILITLLFYYFNVACFEFIQQQLFFCWNFACAFDIHRKCFKQTCIRYADITENGNNYNRDMYRTDCHLPSANGTSLPRISRTVRD